LPILLISVFPRPIPSSWNQEASELEELGAAQGKKRTCSRRKRGAAWW
jgi:hypothetical protein